MIKYYILKKPLLGWAKGEHVSFDTDWGEWTRQKTGETYDMRSSIASGEVALFFNALMNNKLITIFEPISAPLDKTRITGNPGKKEKRNEENPSPDA